MHRDNPYLPENTQHDEPGCHYAPSELPRTFTPEDRATLRDAPNWNNELLCHCDPTPEPVSPLSELTAREVEIAIALAHGRQLQGDRNQARYQQQDRRHAPAQRAQEARLPQHRRPLSARDPSRCGAAVSRILANIPPGRMKEPSTRMPRLDTMQATRHVHGSRKRGRHTSNLWAARLACVLQARGQGPLPYKAKP
jgi:hypothetical protein